MLEHTQKEKVKLCNFLSLKSVLKNVCILLSAMHTNFCGADLQYRTVDNVTAKAW